MALLAICVPIIPGRTEKWNRFLADLNGPRLAEFEASRRALNVRERTFLQHTPEGDVAIVTLEGDDPAAAFGAFGEGRDDFTNWFVAEVMECHGVDLRAAMPSPLPKLVADSRHSERLVRV